MIRTQKYELFKPKGFCAIFSNPFLDKTSNTLRLNALITSIDTKITNEIFINDYLRSNNLYHRMNQFSVDKISIINVWFSPKSDINEFKSKNEKMILLPKNLKENYNPYKNMNLTYDLEPNLTIELYNFHYIDFFDLDVFYNVFYDKNRQFIFFFETTDWNEVVNLFNFLNVSISGGSTNQRHIFSKLHYWMTLKLMILFGRRYTQDLTDFMKHLKSENTVKFKPKLEQMNFEKNKVIKLLHKILLKGADTISNLYIIFKIIILNNSNIESINSRISPIELIFLWSYALSETNIDYKSLYNYILEEIDQGKSVLEILNNINKKYDSIKIDKDISKYSILLNEIYDKDLIMDEYNIDKLFTPTNKSWTLATYNKISFIDKIKFKENISQHSGNLKIKEGDIVNKISTNPNLVSNNAITGDNNLLQSKQLTQSHPSGLLVKEFHSNSISSNEKISFINNLNEAPTPIYQKKEKNISLKKKEKFKLSEYLSSIQNLILENSEIIKTNPSIARNIQKKIEEDWYNIHKLKFESLTEVKSKLSKEFNNQILHIAKRLDALHKRKFLKRKFGKLDNIINDKKWIYMTFSLLINSINKGYNATAINIGENIIYSIYYKWNYQYFKNEEKDPKRNEVYSLYKDLIDLTSINETGVYERMDGSLINISFERWKELLNIDINYILNLGDMFTSFLTYSYSEADEFSLFLRDGSNNNLNNLETFKIIINPEMEDIIKSNMVIKPTSLPMLCLPNDWSKNKTGGFLVETYDNCEIVRSKKNHQHETNYEKSCEVINHINKIKFGVNNLLLDYLESEGSYLIELMENDIKVDKFQLHLTINVAKTYCNIPFYLCNYIDWRGRIYNHSFALNFQGSDLSSSLLQFYEGEALTESGLYYFYINLANNHNQNNISKKSFSSRFNWVVNNYDKIINLDKDFILAAKEKFNFLSLALILREIDKDRNYKVKQPIFLDATCNGIQHVAGLIKDFDLASYTNLTKSTHNDIPEDIYQKIVSLVNKEINQFGAENKEYFNLSNIELTRDILKQSIMTKVYNVTLFGIKEQIKNKIKVKIKDIEIIRQNEIVDKLKDQFKKKKSPIGNWEVYLLPSRIQGESSVLLNYKEIFQISKILNEIIFKTFPALQEVYQFLTSMAKLTVKLQIPLTWITPSGLMFTQHYLKSKTTFVSIKLFGKTRKLNVKEYFNKIDSLKQTSAFIPNMIHSLDASHLYSIILDSKNDGENNILSIHDCFGTHPNKMADLHYRIRKTFIIQYANSDFLLKFRERIVQSIKDNGFKIINIDSQEVVEFYNKQNKKETIIIPKSPKLHSFNIKEIENSSYIIG